MVNNAVDLKVFKVDETKLRIQTSPAIEKELRVYFSARPTGYKFMPLFKSGQWDGFVRFYTKLHMKDHIRSELPIGLLDKLKKFCKSGHYSLSIDFDDELNIEREEFERFVDSLNIPYNVRDYQMDSAYDACCKKRLSINLPTAAGKSLVMYIIARFLEQDNKKVLFIVPKTDLVSQLQENFVEYEWEDAIEKTHLIYSGKEKIFKKPIIISTWQSLFKDKDIFAQFDALIIDECHHAKAKSLTSISKQCYNANWRIGLSGTYEDEGTVDWFGVVGSLGPEKKYTSYKKLKEAGHISGLKIKNLYIQHDKQVAKKNYELTKGDYSSELDFINAIENRNEFIFKMGSTLKKNTFILFNRIVHGKKILELMRNTDKRIFYIDHKTKISDRENIRRILDLKDNIVLVASFGTFAEGINVKNVHNIIFASNYKSKIKVVQAIGRGLRTLEGKEEVVVYDLIDELKHTYYEYHDGKKTKKTYQNHGVRHHKERMKIYRQQGFDDIENKNILLTT